MEPDKLEEELDNQEIIDRYTDFLKMHRFEGETGVRNLEVLVKDLGYKGDCYAYGDPISSFLADNPGCIEAIIEWITDNLTDEQAENLQDAIK